MTELDQILATINKQLEAAKSLGFTLSLSSQNMLELLHEETPCFTQPIGPHYAKYINSPEHSDVVLVVSGNTFHAHRKIIAQKSGFFAGMFGDSFSEAKESQITLLLPTAVAFDIVLRYLYTAEIQNGLSVGSLLSFAVVAEYLAMSSCVERLITAIVERGVVPSELPVALSTDMINTILSQAKDKLAWFELCILNKEHGLDLTVAEDFKTMHDLVKTSISPIFVNLPYDSLIEVMGSYSHLLKFIPANVLYPILQFKIERLTGDLGVGATMRIELLAKLNMEEVKVAGLTIDINRQTCELVDNWPCLHKECGENWYHPGGYRAGFNYGWTCCTATLKKHCGCKRR